MSDEVTIADLSRVMNETRTSLRRDFREMRDHVNDSLTILESGQAAITNMVVK